MWDCHAAQHAQLAHSCPAATSCLPQYDTNALQLAAQAGSLDTVSVLIKSGADINAETNTGRTALLAAAAAGCWEVLRLLLAGRALRTDTVNAMAGMEEYEVRGGGWPTAGRWTY